MDNDLTKTVSKRKGQTIMSKKGFAKGKSGKGADIVSGFNIGRSNDIKVDGYNIVTTKENIVQEQVVQGPNYGAHYKIDLVKVDEIKIPASYPRKSGNDQRIESLIESIKIVNVRDPILAQKLANDEIYLVAGSRRLEAAKKAMKKLVPVIFVKPVSDEEILVNALVTNMHREPLTPLEEAEAIATLVSKHSFSKGMVGLIVGKSKRQIDELLLINALPRNVHRWATNLDSLRAKPIPKNALLKAGKFKGSDEEKVAVIDPGYRERGVTLQDMEENNLRFHSIE